MEQQTLQLIRQLSLVFEVVSEVMISSDQSLLACCVDFPGTRLLPGILQTHPCVPESQPNLLSHQECETPTLPGPPKATLRRLGNSHDAQQSSWPIPENDAVCRLPQHDFEGNQFATPSACAVQIRSGERRSLDAQRLSCESLSKLMLRQNVFCLCLGLKFIFMNLSLRVLNVKF